MSHTLHRAAASDAARSRQRTYPGAAGGPGTLWAGVPRRAQRNAGKR